MPGHDPFAHTCNSKRSSYRCTICYELWTRMRFARKRDLQHNCTHTHTHTHTRHGALLTPAHMCVCTQPTHTGPHILLHLYCTDSTRTHANLQVSIQRRRPAAPHALLQASATKVTQAQHQSPAANICYSTAAAH